MDQIIIPFSKSKTFILFFGALAFVAAGSWLLFGNSRFNNALLDNPLFTRSVGAVAVVFFGFAVYFLLGKLMATGPGLIIDDSGMEDFSAVISTKIYWKDIEAIDVLTIKSQPIILFKVSNPQTYIDNKKGFKRKMMELNYKWYGTPLSISANGLDVSFEELFEMVSDRFTAYKEAKIPPTKR